MFRKIKKTGCDIVKIVSFANSIEDNFKIFELLKKTGKNVIAFCMGEAGEISRLMCLKYGSFLTFASTAKGKESAPGQLTIDEMKNVYHADKINKNTKFVGIIGNPVEHSKSPLLHNKAFEKLNLNFVYVKLRVADLGKFMKNFRKYFYGAGVTIPYKVEIIKYLDTIENTAKNIGAVNTIVNNGGTLCGYNTDYKGAIDALKKKTDLQEKKAVILGAGGAARAISYGLKKEGADIIILNRTLKKAALLANEVKGRFGGLEKIKDVKYDIIINTTSVGMWPNTKVSPIDRKYLKDKLVFDIVYNPVKTKLIRDAEKQKCIVVNGMDMFFNQAKLQFELWTTKIFPFKEVKEWA